MLAGIVLIGAVARFYGLGALPPGLYHDEAFNAQDALRVLAGDRPIFFEANNGREPLFLYGMALALAAFGRTPFAIRVTAAILGTLTIPAAFWMGRALFGERVGLWSAALLAMAPWPISLSRIGLRAVSMPLLIALGLWLWWDGRRTQGTRRTVSLALGGALLGLSLYTYTAARLVVVAVAGFALFQTLVRRERLDRSEWLTLSLTAVLATMPLIVYGATHLETFVARPGQVSILSTEINHGDPAGLLARNIVRAAGLFTFQGDSIPRHNVPSRPLFDPLVSIPFFVGVVVCLGKLKRDPACALAVVWTGTMLIPTILAEDCPHFLRAVGVLPVAMVFPSLGLEWIRDRLVDRAPPWTGHALVAFVLVIGGIWGIGDYYRYATDPELGYAFEADQLQEAIEINRFLGTGWQGRGIVEPLGTPIAGRHVYLGPRMWENRHTVNVMVGSPDRISILGRDPVVDADQVLAMAWPHGDMSAVRDVLPTPGEVTVWPGPLERGDLDPEPALLYVAFRGDSLVRPSETVARFEAGIELLGWSAETVESGNTRLHLRWRTLEPLAKDYTVFAHLERDGTIVAQDDRPPGAGYYPTMWWKPGDEIVDTHILTAAYDPHRDRIWVGWYELTLMQHLRVLNGNAQPEDERLALR
jgi:hypothetical protein